MEKTDKDGSDALKQLEDVTVKLEDHIDNFKFTGTNLTGTIKTGFMHNPEESE